MGTISDADLARGRGQVPLRHALRWSFGQNLRSREALVNSLLWGTGMGIVNAVTNHEQRLAAFLASFLVAFCVGYLSMIPWRWRIVPRGAPFGAMLAANGFVAFLLGYVCFYVCLWAGMFLVNGPQVFEWYSLYRIFAYVSSVGILFPIIGFYIAMGYDVERARRRTARAQARLERLAEEARIVALRAQINPHFFFNALNTIAALIPERPADAERAVELMATSLRPVLMRDQPLAATLESELRVARAYLEIERLRLGDRLQVRFDIEPGLDGAMMPSLCLQPLVENAVRHAASKSSLPTEVSVVARRDGDALRIDIANRPAAADAAAPDPSWTEVSPVQGHALHNLRVRLQALCGPESSLSVRVSPDGSSALASLFVPPIAAVPEDRP